MNYLIFRDDGVGDLIVSTSMLNEIKKYDEKAKITLISSNRNNIYANILLKENFLDHNINADVYSGFINKIVKIFFQLRKRKFDHIFILKSSSFSFILSLLLNSNSVSGIVPLNSSSNGKDKYKPIKYLINFIFNYYEIVDCRNDYKNSSHIHMKEHYLSLLNKTFKLKNKKGLIQNYYIPYSPLKKINNSRENPISNILNDKKIILFHFDEKWNMSNYLDDKILNLIREISTMYNYVLIITYGLEKNKYDKFITDNLDFYFINSINRRINLYQSKSDKNIFSIRDTNIEDIIFLITNSDIVIEPHGALNHIASIFNKPVIDLIPRGKETFLLKWKPTSRKMVQVDLDNADMILRAVKNILT